MPKTQNPAGGGHNQATIVKQLELHECLGRKSSCPSYIYLILRSSTHLAFVKSTSTITRSNVSSKIAIASRAREIKLLVLIHPIWTESRRGDIGKWSISIITTVGYQATWSFCKAVSIWTSPTEPNAVSRSPAKFTTWENWEIAHEGGFRVSRKVGGTALISNGRVLAGWNWLFCNDLGDGTGDDSGLIDCSCKRLNFSDCVDDCRCNLMDVSGSVRKAQSPCMWSMWHMQGG